MSVSQSSPPEARPSPRADADVLDSLLAPVSLEGFARDYYGRCPLALAGVCGDWTIASVDAFAELFTTDDAAVFVGGGSDVWTGERPSNYGDAKAVLAAGQTMCDRQAQRRCVRLRALSEAFQRVFLAAIDIHVVFTAGGRPGFGWHYDAEHVFNLQLLGAKQWRLRKNTVNPWPLLDALPQDMCYERERSPLLCCTLTAGDLLYIPAGYWHCTAADSESVSLSIGVAPHSGLDVLEYLLHRLRDDLSWRQPLPLEEHAGKDGWPAWTEHLRSLAPLIVELFGEPTFVQEYAAYRARAVSRSSNADVR